MKRETIRTEDAAGRILLHDITEIIPGKKKGPAFRKGHIITPGDIEKLRDLGKERIFVGSIPDSEYHEDEAAEIFRGFAGKNVSCRGPVEGKISFFADADGLFTAGRRSVDRVNSIGGIALACLAGGTPVKTSEKLGGVRIIPLSLSRKKVRRAAEEAPLLEVSPFRKKKIGIIVTGTEVASGRIKDGFRSVIEEKCASYKSPVGFYRVSGDDPDEISGHLRQARSSGCTLLVVTGGMSVDPDDVTAQGIKRSGAEISFHGIPVLPGNMLLAGYLEGTPLLGVPACALYHSTTSFDIFLAYAFADVRMERKTALSLGSGGFCSLCENCIYPRCGFGKC